MATQCLPPLEAFESQKGKYELELENLADISFPLGFDSAIYSEPLLEWNFQHPQQLKPPLGENDELANAWEFCSFLHRPPHHSIGCRFSCPNRFSTN